MVSQSRRAELRLRLNSIWAVCYDNGQGVAKDDAEAVKWYRKAAEQNDAWAQFNLGYCYANGQGVAKDKVEAVKWYRKAAEQNYAVLNPIWAGATTMARAWRRMRWRR